MELLKDLSSARDVMNEFKPNNNLRREDIGIAKGVNQYVDPTKKTKD